jgi:hypothetical protein
MTYKPTAYTKLIADALGCTGDEAVMVEAAMRLTYPTLDGLSRERFNREARESLAFVKACPDDARGNALSFGFAEVVP